MDAGGFRLFAPQEECGSGKAPRRGDFVNVAQVFFHERGGAKILELESKLFELIGGAFGQVLFVAQQQEAFSFEFLFLFGFKLVHGAAPQVVHTVIHQFDDVEMVINDIGGGQNLFDP